ncbi:unnamed protein product, partial [Ectocarpus sp. 12 AP-2014]
EERAWWGWAVRAGEGSNRTGLLGTRYPGVRTFGCVTQHTWNRARAGKKSSIISCAVVIRGWNLRPSGTSARFLFLSPSEGSFTKTAERFVPNQQQKHPPPKDRVLGPCPVPR